MKPLLCALLLVAACADVGVSGTPASSSTLALSRDDRQLWVVNPDADSVSLLDMQSRSLLAEIALGDGIPAVDRSTSRYDPAITPRSLTLLPDESKLYVAGQTANRVYVVDTATRQVMHSIAVGSEPVAVLAAPDGHAVFVVCYQSATVSQIDPATDRVVATLQLPAPAWGGRLKPRR